MISIREERVIHGETKVAFTPSAGARTLTAGWNSASREITRWRSTMIQLWTTYRRGAGLALVATVVGSLLFWPSGPASAQTVREVFQKVVPSVVVIRARGRDVEAAGETRFTETGSGVLISSDGKVMTAAHVVQTMDEIAVEFIGGETVAARVVASEPAADLSLLQLDRVPSGVKVAPMADSNRVHVGDPAVIVGAPYGLSYSLSAGYISARWAPNTVYKTMPMAEFFQTDAVINTGNSGGPMFNMQGEVIGIVSHNISKSGGSEGLGFVVTLNTAKQLLLEKRSFWGGLEIFFLPDEIADLLNLPARSSGFVVKTVAKDSPGDHLGLRGSRMIVKIAGQDVPLGGDIVMSIEGVSATPPNTAKIRDKLASMPAGTPIKVTILRGGQVLELTGKVP
jgi:serine protease Do